MSKNRGCIVCGNKKTIMARSIGAFCSKECSDSVVTCSEAWYKYEKELEKLRENNIG